MDLSATYNDAEYTKTTEVSGVEVGESLPFAPTSTANFGLEYEFDLLQYPSFIRADVNYFGEAETNTKAKARPSVGDYVLIGFRAGVMIDSWELALYGKNLTNEDNPTFFAAADVAGRLTPRKLGLEINYTF